jgi:hypothetical protein
MAKGRKTGGRRKGTPNRFSVTLKDLILGALEDAGGQAYLAEQAKKSPQAFLSLVGRVLPLQMKADNADPQMPRRVIMELDEQ